MATVGRSVHVSIKADCGDPGLEAWIAMLKVLSHPAALVDASGAVIFANRWLDLDPGAALLEPAKGRSAKGLQRGLDGESRWRVRPLGDHGNVLLATSERDGIGDHLMRKFFSTGDSLFGVYDQAGRIIESNGAWESVLGYTQDELLGLDTWTLLPPNDVVTRAAVEKELREKGRSDPSWKMRHADGTYLTVQWSLHFDPSVGRCFAVGRDLDADNRRVDELHRRAYTDPLTGLANRARMLADLEQLLAHDGYPAVLFCDLDQFKIVNDSLGHAFGDHLLAALGTRLDRAFAADGCLMSRFGGDEFVVLVPDATLLTAEAKAGELLAVMNEPFSIDGRSIHVTMSVGVAVSVPGYRTSAEQLLGQADQASYRAKERGRNQYVTFDRELQSTVDRRFQVEQSLRQALKDDQFEVHYQPVVSLKRDSDAIVGVEALVRWRRTDGSVMAPGGFIDVAIDAGLMSAIGSAVLNDALSATAALQLDRRGCFLSINTSAFELRRTGYVDELIEAVEAHGLAPSTVVVEITESTALAIEETPERLARLRAAGIRIALDDFGTGYSSLAHLRELPIDIVKIDRSFVSEVTTDPVTQAMTRSLIELCSVLDLEVIIEGIESRAQCAEIRRLGGRTAQGYLFHRPMPVAELRGVLAHQAAVAPFVR